MRARFSALGLALVLAACVGDTPPHDLPAPDPAKIVVFYPLDSKVKGRGAPGTIPPGVGFVYVAPHPSPVTETFEVEEDGSFAFDVSAGSSNVLEIAAARDKDGVDRGAPSFITVPQIPPRVFGDDYYCCKPRGRIQGLCVRASEENPVCDGDNPLLTCRADAECAPHSGRIIDFPIEELDVSPPDKTGRITIRPRTANKFPPNVLIQVENRGQRAIGGYDAQDRDSQLTDESGLFQMIRFARGDDELVFTIYDLDGLRSRQHSVLVPDAPLAGIDIVGVFPFDNLVNGDTGRVAIRFSPYGVDGRGICPQSTTDPILCFSGGLDYNMITLDQVSIATEPVGDRVAPSTATTDTPNTRATDGDVLGGPQVLVLLLDTTKQAVTADPEGIRFLAATDFVNGLRNRDRLGIISIGGVEGGLRIESAPSADKPGLANLVLQLQSRAPLDIAPEIFKAVRDAAALIKNVPGFDLGRIVIITTQAQPSSGTTAAAQDRDRMEFDTAYSAVEPNPTRLFKGYATYVVGLELQAQMNTTRLQDLAIFSGGDFVDVSTPNELISGVARVTGAVSGAYVLLYDVPIPRNAGKVASAFIRATVRLPGADGMMQEQSGEFSGTIEVKGAQ